MDYLQKMSVVMGKNLCEDVIVAGCEVAINHFRNSLQTLYDLIELCRIVEDETYVGTGLVTHRRGINNGLEPRSEGYVLIGPGRWGSSDSALGIPVRWSQITGARLIVESALPGYRIEPSQGTHFFQNLTSFGVGYFTVDQPGGQGMIDTAWLDTLPAVYESDALRIVEFPEPLTIAINGRKSKGIVMKPGIAMQPGIHDSDDHIRPENDH